MATNNFAGLINSSTIIDLSLTLSEDLPCWWPSAVRYRQTNDNWFGDADGPAPLRRRTGGAYRTNALELDEHTGTHFDAPSHFIPPPYSGLPYAGPAGAITCDRVELTQLIGTAAVIDVRTLVGTSGPGTSPRIEPTHVTEWETEHGRLEPGEIVLFFSGWDERYLPGEAGKDYVENPFVFRSTPAWPAPTPSTIELLLGRGIRCVGTDGVSMGSAEDGGPTHVVGLSAGMVYVEALCHLDAVPTRGALFLFLPIKLGGGSGGPGRAVA